MGVAIVGEGAMGVAEFSRRRSEFRTYNQSKGLAQRTVQSYDERLRLFERWLSAEYRNVEAICTKRIREYIAIRLGEAKPSTVRAQVEALRVFYKFLVEDEVIIPSDNPMRFVKAVKARPPEIEPLCKRKAQEFLATFDQGSPTGYRNYIICLLILDTGLRAGEVTGLMLDDIDLESGKVRVRGKGNKRRVVYMGERMRGKLNDYLNHCRRWIANGEPVLFPSASGTLTSKHLSMIVREKMDEVGIKPMHSTTHRLRHTFAIMYLKNGGDAFSLQRLLGHYDLEMTKRYIMLADSDLQEAHRKASPVDNLAL